MTSTISPPTETSTQPLPAVPLTLEGASVLHQMMRIKWTAWKALDTGSQTEIVAEAARLLEEMEKNPTGQSALFFQLGHKGDLIFIHFRQSFDDLSEAERQFAHLRLFDYLEPT